ncbi:MAG TPA: 16S rRNA (guanine(966)-N(2))-methyltransferase RsmD [Paenalcaligenes sp.]|nr:16S rRNA (guanine(966)-N(2))-methyltransferase RsmD [Paenalcaligenes sp.]
MANQTVRIVGGQYRGRRIPIMRGNELRPTPDRVRETLFNWLRHFWAGHFADKQVLDLFAGTGVLGFEAASHGVAFVQLVEQNQRAAQALRQFRNTLGAEQIRIHHGDAMHVLERSTHQYDLILLDPPFGQGWFERIWPHLPNLLTPQALIYVEAEKRLTIPASYHILRQQKAGHVHYQLLEFAGEAKKDNNAQ